VNVSVPAPVAVAAAPTASYIVDVDEFVRENGPALARTAFLLTGDHQLGEDLVQTALAKVVVRWDRVTASGHPGAYVRQTMVRTAIGWRRRRWHAETPVAAVPEASVPEDHAAVDRRDRLRRALLTLPPRQRAAVILRFYEDRCESDVATLMGCSVGTVKSQTARGLARLRNELNGDHQ
jgi:RNA polymerase sigma-70 factor (sigma-E family)